MITAYRFCLGDDGAGDGGGWVWLYCPVCSAAYPVAPFEDTSCPNTDQPDHQPDHNDGEVR